MTIKPRVFAPITQVQALFSPVKNGKTLSVKPSLISLRDIMPDCRIGSVVVTR